MDKSLQSGRGKFRKLIAAQIYRLAAFVNGTPAMVWRPTAAEAAAVHFQAAKPITWQEEFEREFSYDIALLPTIDHTAHFLLETIDQPDEFSHFWRFHIVEPDGRRTVHMGLEKRVGVAFLLALERAYQLGAAGITYQEQKAG